MLQDCLNNNYILLSICIPTYNRASFLQECLASIVGNFNDENIYHQIEIIISDNASDDNTNAIVCGYQRKFGNISYYKNSENLGYDVNVLNTLKKSRGKYCWMINDNIIIERGTLKYLLLSLNSDLDAYIIGDGSQETIYRDGSEALDKCGIFGGKLYRNILKRTKIPDGEKYIGNLWIHFSLILEVVATSKVGLIKGLIITDRDQLSDWARKDGKVFVAFVKLKAIIDNCIELGYDPLIIRKIKRQLLFDSPGMLMSAKVNGYRNNLNNFVLLFKFPLFFPLLFVIFLVPIPIFLFLKKAKNNIFN